MPKRIVKQPVTVYRQGKAVSPKIGDLFEFTDKEVAEISSMTPKALVMPKGEAAPAPAVVPKKDDKL